MNIDIKKNFPLSGMTTLGVGGAASHYVSVHTVSELREACQYAREHTLRIIVLGGGSNILVPDRGIDALVIHPEFSDIVLEEKEGSVFVTAGAGVGLDTLVTYAVDSELWGIENLSGIPGSVGAVPIQNVGAYGVEAKDVVYEVEAYDPLRGECVTLLSDDCMFDYRDSVFKHAEGKNLIVIRVTFRLTRTAHPLISYKDLALYFGANTNPTLSEIHTAVIAIRRGKFPDWSVVGTAGSFFKNPVIPQAEYNALKARFPELPGFPSNNEVKIPLGWILDKMLHARGYREGNVGLYEKQALVLVNHGGATTDEIVAFSDAIIKKIYDATSIRVEREVVLIE